MDENWFKNKSLWSRWKNAYLKDANFRKFWKNFNKKNLDKDLVKLVDYYISSESYKFSSRFWNIINIRHINQINEFGIENFATTIAMSYFTSIVYKDEQVKNILDYLAEKKISSSNYSNQIFKQQLNLDFSHSVNHNIILNLLYAYLKDKKIYTYLKLLEKNNFLIDKMPNIEIENQKITQDKLNSLLEFINIDRIIDKISSTSLNILEIGAGSGRTTETIISLLENKKKIKYVIVDIPPALYINYLRIKNNYPNKKIKIALGIESFESLKEIYEKNDIILILPHQLNYF